MGATIAFFAFVIVAGFLMFRMVQARDASLEATGRERPRRMSSRDRKLAKIREFEESIPPRPTIQELMMEEVRETGVDAIEGGDGIELPVRLKVWHRDQHVRRGCTDAGLRFVVHQGVDPAAATVDDVMLVCTRPEPASVDDAAEDSTAAG